MLSKSVRASLRLALPIPYFRRKIGRLQGVPMPVDLLEKGQKKEKNKALYML